MSILQRINDGTFSDRDNDGLVHVAHIEDFIQEHWPDPAKLREELRTIRTAIPDSAVAGSAKALRSWNATRASMILRYEAALKDTPTKETP